MSGHDLIVALGSRRYRVERPFGSWPRNSGRVTDVAVDAEGQVHVLLRHDPLTDPDDARVIVLSSEGAFLRAWGGAEIADSHLMSFDPVGRLWVVDRDMHEIIGFSGTGDRVATLGARGRPLAPFNHPSDITFSTWGDVYVSGGYAGRHVHRFDRSGALTAEWGGAGDGPGQFLEPHALHVHRDGRVAVVDRVPNRVQVFDRDGGLMQIWTGFHRPVGIWGDDAGFTYVTDQTPNLHLFDPAGRWIGCCRPVLNGAHGICGTPNGDLYLAEGNPSRVTRLVLLKDNLA